VPPPERHPRRQGYGSGEVSTLWGKVPIPVRRQEEARMYLTHQRTELLVIVGVLLVALVVGVGTRLVLP
jgi:hypothetical protein